MTREHLPITQFSHQLLLLVALRKLFFPPCHGTPIQAETHFFNYLQKDQMQEKEQEGEENYLGNPIQLQTHIQRRILRQKTMAKNSYQA